MTKLPDSERDVYGTFAVAVMNAIRQAERSQMLMSEGETRIVEGLKECFIDLDPTAEYTRKAKVVLR